LRLGVPAVSDLMAGHADARSASLRGGEGQHGHRKGRA
jgi:hypothetical protein